MSDQPAADVFVIFGITGDLAKVMTFHSLYRLEARGLIDCPIVGVAVDDWTVDDLVARARQSIEDCGETIDDAVFQRLADRLSYVSGDFSDAGTFAKVAKAIEGKQTPVFYLEIPPFLFGAVIKGLSDAGLDGVGPGRGGEAVRPRRRLGARPERGGPPLHRRVAALPDRPLPRKDGPGRDPLPALREHAAGAGLEPQLRGVRADHDGGELRRRRPRALLRPGGSAARRGGQPPDAGSRGDRDGAAGRRRSRDAEGFDLQRLQVDRVRRSSPLRSRPVRRLQGDRRRRRRLEPPRRTPLCASTSRTGAGLGFPSTSARASACPRPRPRCGWSSRTPRGSGSGSRPTRSPTRSSSSSTPVRASRS